jgi:3-oxoacyl-[acyl-carrier protein] reductase
MNRFEGRVAVVTGAAQGIGAAVARKLAAEGARVAVVDVDEDRTQQTVKQIVEAGGTAVGIGCDVSDAAAVRGCVERVGAEFGRLDILVNNAGVTRDNLVHKMSESDWDLVVDVNLKGAFLMSQAAQALMVQARYGKIVNLSSVSALGNRGQANYSAAKAGIQGLTATLGAELGRFGINVNAVGPGYVATAMTAATAERLGVSVEQAEQAAAAQIPLGRVGQPEDIADVVAFLVSEDARYVTGQTLYVNGGMR